MLGFTVLDCWSIRKAGGGGVDTVDEWCTVQYACSGLWVVPVGRRRWGDGVYCAVIACMWVVGCLLVHSGRGDGVYCAVNACRQAFDALGFASTACRCHCVPTIGLL